MSEVPANVAAARQQAITTDYYALGYLALAMAAYSKESSISCEVIEKAIREYLIELGNIGDVPGVWTLDWGPAITENLKSWRANLLFAASYRDAASNLPFFSAVVIRGTDTSAGFLGVLTQLKEDLEPGSQIPWPDPAGTSTDAVQQGADTPCVAQGTFLGFNDLINLQGENQSTGKQQTVAQFLAEVLPANADSAAPLPLIVTGHSLGGCQTSPMALYINSLPSAQSGVTVVPHSFAAPTAGNPAFANLYLSTLPHARRWFNTFDLIPMAFDNLSTMRELWSEAPYDCGHEIPFLASLALDHFIKEVSNLQYAHEGGTANRQLNGVCGQPSGKPIDQKFPWGAQLMYQHFPETGYWPLMASQYASVLGKVNLAFPEEANG